ncbi:MAG TPA: nucleoside monophosphate kinase, partial [Candidatus Paceibacterota bacterium]
MHKIEKLKYDLIAFVAPQGGGKDTQMEILKASLPCETTALISMSDVLRHYRSTDREFDEQTSLMMARGILIGDDIVVGRLMKYIQEECRGKTTILLNGFPRTIAQAFGLWAIKCHVLGPQARVAILKFELSKEDAYKRCLKR